MQFLNNWQPFINKTMVYSLLETQNYKYKFHYKYIFFACATSLVTQSLLVTESFNSDVSRIMYQVAGKTHNRCL